MKTQFNTIQFSGYPLRLVETKADGNKPDLYIVPPTPDLQTSFQENEITNDPANWDERWFSNYE